MIHYEVLWTSVARDDLDDIANYIIEEDGVDAALMIVSRLELKATKLVTMPNRGVIAPELRDIGVMQYRQLSEPPWRIFYRILGAVVHVVAVVDSRRDLPGFLMERLMRIDRI
ncbi:MAG: type II toxin-antitoxin system RelE/ParE family toxin [Mariprofundus sp.]